MAVYIPYVDVKRIKGFIELGRNTAPRLVLYDRSLEYENY